MNSPSELSKRERELQREVSKEFGRADQRRAGGMHRSNVYLEENSRRLAQKGELSLTLRALLRAGQGTTLGKVLEDQVKLERGKRDLDRARVQLIEDKGELQNTVNLIYAPTDEDRSAVGVKEVIKEFRANFYPDVLELIGEDGLWTVTDAMILMLIFKNAAADPALDYTVDEEGVINLNRDNGAALPRLRELQQAGQADEETIRKAVADDEARHEWAAEYVGHTIGWLDDYIALIFLGAKKIIAQEIELEELEERLRKHGERWERNVTAALSGIAAAWAKFSEGRTIPEDEAEVWFEGYTVAFASATQVDLQADELMRVILQYVEGGPPGALGVLRTYF